MAIVLCHLKCCIRSFSTLIKRRRQVIAYMASPSAASQRQVACNAVLADSPKLLRLTFAAGIFTVCLHSFAVDQLIKICLYSAFPVFFQRVGKEVRGLQDVFRL